MGAGIRRMIKMQMGMTPVPARFIRVEIKAASALIQFLVSVRLIAY